MANEGQQDPPAGPERPPPSWGNISEQHWSRARAGSNPEALEYLRSRTQAPGVRGGGGARNFWCMRCDGVIPGPPAPSRCPHCGIAIEGRARRSFNWVEIDQAPGSDARVLMPLFALSLAGLAALVFVLWWWLR